MKTKILPVIIVVSLLAACGDEKTPDKAANAAPTASLPADAPAVGASINSLIKPPDAELAKLKTQNAEYKELAWEDLELPGQGLADIMKKYQPQIDAIPEGDSKENAVLEKMQTELNNAPVNPALNGKKVKLPGFVSPLEVDEKTDTVKEFLLVPFFGACIHVPPPPVNQTILVTPQSGKSISMGDMYSPVWVYGTLSTAGKHTDLADAGYQITDARVEIYQEAEPAKTGN
jgi:hypothetical protein